VAQVTDQDWAIEVDDITGVAVDAISAEQAAQPYDMSRDHVRKYFECKEYKDLKGNCPFMPHPQDRPQKLCACLAGLGLDIGRVPEDKRQPWMKSLVTLATEADFKTAFNNGKTCNTMNESWQAKRDWRSEVMKRVAAPSAQSAKIKYPSRLPQMQQQLASMAKNLGSTATNGNSAFVQAVSAMRERNDPYEAAWIGPRVEAAVIPQDYLQGADVVEEKEELPRRLPLDLQRDLTRAGVGCDQHNVSFGKSISPTSCDSAIVEDQQQPSSSGLPKGELSVQMSGLHECAAGHDQSSGVKVDLCDLGSQSGLKQTPADVNLSTSPTPMCTNIPPNVVASSVLTTGDAAAVGATTCLQEPVVPRQDGPLSEEHILRYFGPVPTEFDTNLAAPVQEAQQVGAALAESRQRLGWSPREETKQKMTFDGLSKKCRQKLSERIRNTLLRPMPPASNGKYPTDYFNWEAPPCGYVQDLDCNIFTGLQFEKPVSSQFVQSLSDLQDTLLVQGCRLVSNGFDLDALYPVLAEWCIRHQERRRRVEREVAWTKQRVREGLTVSPALFAQHWSEHVVRVAREAEAIIMNTQGLPSGLRRKAAHVREEWQNAVGTRLTELGYEISRADLTDQRLLEVCYPDEFLPHCARRVKQAGQGPCL